jgi:hypothetical protein
MKTIFVILILLAAGLFTKLLWVVALNLAGLPGALAAGQPGLRSKHRFIFGSLISALGQSYLYLAYIALIVSWTRLSAEHQDVTGWIVWPFAFFAVVVPILSSLFTAKAEAAELAHANPQVEALHLTVIVSLLGFVAFAAFPKLARTFWAWVPFVS